MCDSKQHNQLQQQLQHEQQSSVKPESLNVALYSQRSPQFQVLQELAEGRF